MDQGLSKIAQNIINKAPVSVLRKAAKVYLNNATMYRKVVKVLSNLFGDSVGNIIGDDVKGFIKDTTNSLDDDFQYIDTIYEEPVMADIPQLSD